MIDFRYHVISIVAVFLALATGLVLGASLLNTQLIETQNAQNESLINDKNALRDELDALQQEQDSLEQFITASGPLIVRDLLVGQRVVIVALPGAEEGAGQDIVDGITADALNAGAVEVVGTVSITDQWTDPGEVDVLDGLTAQLTQEGIDLPEGTAYDRAAVLLASALVGPQSGSGAEEQPPTTPTTPPDDTLDPAEGLNQQEISTILEGLSAGGFIAYDSAPTGLADVAIVVSPPAPEAVDDTTDTVNAAWIRLAVALDDIGSGGVVTGPSTAAETGGVIEALRADAAAADVVSSVDSAEADPGQIATVVALAAELTGQTGHYGQVGDVDGPIPVLTGAEAG